MKLDVLIIGSGVAALSCAINLPQDLEVLVLTKDEQKGANSYWAQGGIAVALDEQDVASHIQDTIEAGAKRNNAQAVEILSSKSREIVDSLIELGMEFDTTGEGELHYTKEGAHSTNRVLHAGGDATGKALNTFLASKNRHTVKLATVIDLLIEGSICYGATILDKDGIRENIYADNVVIASGGMGGLFEFSTNATGINADLQGIVIEKRVAVRDMHMLQFHPTVFVSDKNEQKFLISEAVRGEGAKLIDSDGLRFMENYDKERMELAPRDVISRSIFLHKQNTQKEVFLDLRSFEKKFFEERFPTIYQKLHDFGFDITKDPIPISPAFHYAMGGVTTDLAGKAPGMENLFAMGEVASTMVHGANRLASNSLLEALVFGKIVAENIKKNPRNNARVKFAMTQEVLELERDKEINSALRVLMWEKVGIIRTQNRLDEALKQVNNWLSEPIGRFMKLRLFTAKEVIQDAIEHTESQGAHFINKG